MSRIAPLWDGWARANRGWPGRLTGASTVPGQSFLENVFPSGRLLVEVAWGADPAGDPAVWSWSDITTDVYQQSISFRYGRLDQSRVSNPASGGLTLRNVSHDYSQGPLSSYWPNVRLYLPIRIQVDVDGYGYVTIFQGNVTRMVPGWDITGGIPTMVATLAGGLERIGYGNAAAVSAPKRYMLSLPDSIRPLVYYPLDDGPLSFTGAAAIGTGTATIRPYYPQDSPVKVLGQGRLAPWLPEGASLANEGSASGVSGQLTCPFPSTPVATSQWIVGLEISYVEGQPDQNNGFEGIEIAVGATSTDVWSLNLIMNTRQLVLRKPNTTAPLLTQTETITFDGDMHYIQLYLTQVSADVYFQYIVDGVTAATAIVTNTSVTHPLEARIYTTGKTARYFGHLELWVNGAAPGTNIDHRANQVTPAMLGYNVHRLFGLLSYQETAPERMVRLCIQTDTELDMIGQTSNAADTAIMGCQPTKNLVDLLRECEIADQGRLYDGIGAGITYVCRNWMENQTTAALTIDVSAFELLPPFESLLDRQGRINVITAQRTLGRSARYERSDGMFGTAMVGPMDDSVEVNTESDDRITDWAAWLVAAGTVEGYRYPTVAVCVTVLPGKARQILAMRPGMRLDLTNVGAVLDGHDTEDVRLLVEGISHDFGYGVEARWVVTFQCTAYAPWRIGELAAATGDTNPDVLRLVPTTSRLVDAAAAGATSLTVETTAGPRWSVNSDDWPIEITVGGQRARVTSIAGTGTTQTFTIDPLELGRPALSPVDVWDAGGLRM